MNRKNIFTELSSSDLPDVRANHVSERLCLARVTPMVRKGLLAIPTSHSEANAAVGDMGALLMLHFVASDSAVGCIPYSLISSCDGPMDGTVRAFCQDNR